MNYPTLSEYVQAIRFSEDNFDKLSNLRPVLDADGNPIMSSGNFAVVFKMEDMQSGKLYAVKCFYKEQEGREDSYKLITSELEYVSSTFLTPIKYLEKELFVDTTQRNDTEFPVLLMDWVEGLTLDKYIRNNIHDKYKLSLIAYQFCRMGSWLLSQEFAHGDLKPDNIIVREDGQLVLVDYDGMFVPAMRGQKSRELGSVDYSHPLRKEDVFNSSIDDFSIASIALSLKAISLKPELLNEFGAEDRLLFCAKDYQNIGESECLKAIQSLSNDVELAQLLGLFYIAYARNELSNVSFKLYNIAKPEYVPVIAPEVEFSTEVTDEDLENAIEDWYGVKYSKDGVKLLKAPQFYLDSYKIKEGTKVICDNAFFYCSFLREITLPSSVIEIGNFTFFNCENLSNIELSSSLISVGLEAFSGCCSLSKLVLPSSIMNIGDFAFSNCESLREITLPSSIISIGIGTFGGCKSLCKVILPTSLINIGDNMFSGCESLYEVLLPSSLISIGKEAFKECKSLSNIILSSSVLSIGISAFEGCKSLRNIMLPSSLSSIGSSAFSGCESLYKITIPSLVTKLDFKVFEGCKSLYEIKISPYTTNIGEIAFKGCKSLREFTIPSSITGIGAGAFCGCRNLKLYNYSSVYEIIDNSLIVSNGGKIVVSCFGSKKKVILPSSVINIGNFAFSDCDSLYEISFSYSVKSIGDGAFSNCKSLHEIYLPPLVKSIGFIAFNGCESLSKVVLSSSIISIGELAFSGCSLLNSIVVPKGQTERFRELLKNAGCDLSIIKEQDE